MNMCTVHVPVFLHVLIHHFLRASGTKVAFCEIVHHYCLSLAFVYDFIAVLPIELFSFMGANEIERWRLYAWLKLNRLFKAFVVSFSPRLRVFHDVHVLAENLLIFSQLPYEFSREENFFEGSVLMRRIFKLLVYIAILSHWVACALFVVCSNTTVNPNDHWIRSYAINGIPRSETNAAGDYVHALYWAVAIMTSTGL